MGDKICSKNGSTCCGNNKKTKDDKCKCDKKDSKKVINFDVEKARIIKSKGVKDE